MRYGIAVLAFLAAVATGASAHAATASGKVVYVESFNQSTTWIEWGVVMLRPASGPWLNVWIKSSIPEETGRRILESAGRATNGHTFSFYYADQNPSWPAYFSVTNFAVTELRVNAAVPLASVTWGGLYNSPVTVKGRIARVTIYGSGTTIVTLGSQNYDIPLPQDSGRHYSRLFTVAAGGADADHDVEFRNLWYNGSTSGGVWGSTSVNSYKARNQ